MGYDRQKVGRWEDVELASSARISDYIQWQEAKNTAAISRMLRKRFEERYIRPVLGAHRHGFTIMSVSCLMVEALVSFQQGWRDTKRMRSKPFDIFFFENREFHPLTPHSEAFYVHVRCGLLHQAETTGGWRILRIGPLFSVRDSCVNAVAFIDALGRALSEYCERLESTEWDSELWARCRRKLNAICENAKPKG